MAGPTHDDQPGAHDLPRQRAGSGKRHDPVPLPTTTLVGARTSPSRFSAVRRSSSRPRCSVECAQRRGPQQRPARGPQVAVGEAVVCRDPRANRSDRERQPEPGERRRADQRPERRQREQAVEGLQRRQTRGRCGQHQRRGALGMRSRQPDSDRTSKAVTDDRRAIDAETVELSQRRLPVAGQITCAGCDRPIRGGRSRSAVPARRVPRSRRPNRERHRAGRAASAPVADWSSPSPRD